MSVENLIPNQRPKPSSTDTIRIGMRRVLSLLIFLLALVSSGCPRRSPAARIIFAPSAPAPAPSVSAEAAGALVLAEPEEPESEPEPAPPIAEPAEKPHPKPRVRLAPPDPLLEPEPEPSSVAEVPTLEPREGPAAQATQRRQVAQLQDQIRARIARQDGPGLSGDERRMVTDARTFLAQSERALAANDFQRALTLARKASLLLAVLEQQ